MAMREGGLLRVREAFQSINPSERKAADYIIRHPEKMVHMTVSELSDASGSSRSAIIRLCKTLGFKGYQEFKLCVAGDLQNSDSRGDAYKEINPDSDLQTIVESVSANNIRSIHETLSILDTQKLQEAIDLIEKASRIDFYGIGASQLVAQDAQTKFMRINKNCTAYSDHHLQLTSAVTLTANDVALAISNSGETLQTVECIEAARQSGAKAIGLTRYGNNTLSRLVDVPIQILSSESNVRSAATSSRIVQLTIIDIIYVAVAGHHYEQSLNYLNRSLAAIKKNFRLR